MKSLLLCGLLFFAALPSSGGAASSLGPGQSLADGATIVSPGGVFELGFFSPGRSNNRYVGIWYHNFPTTTILWVANRENPVVSGSGSIAVATDGNLVVLDGGRRVLWSSNVSSLSSPESTAELLDTGDLLLNNSGELAWQSFDHPSDAYLPGMKVGLDLITGVNHVFTSWRSTDDPAQGNFTLGIAPDLSTQIFVWDSGKPRWRSGRWNGQVFIGIQNMVPTYIYGFKLNNFEQEKKMYFYYDEFNSSHLYVLMPDGVVRHLVWGERTKSWYQFWAQPVTECEIYNRCGNFAGCVDGEDGRSPACSCLKGYVPAANGTAGGCVRRMPLQCEKNSSSGSGEPDGFYLMQGVKLPDLSDWDSDSLNASQCEKSCLRNCSCKAYSFVTGIGCLIWARDLMDIHIFSGGGGGGNDLFLRLAGSEFDVKVKSRLYVIVIVVLLTVGFSAGSACLWRKCKKRVDESLCRRSRAAAVVDEGGGADRSRGFSAVIDVHGPEKREKSHDVALFSFETIARATKSFSPANMLGEGGFGPVYKGVLPGGQEIAVKRLSGSSGQGMDELKNEVLLVAELQHRNLVKLLGFCIRREHKILVYEYMPNRSLDSLLFDPCKQQLLNWKTRYSIIEGIARGLLYLHRDSRLRIIHRDLKASNVLLDKEMNPKISDFGMARIFGVDSHESATKRVVGTYGYMSPEYAMQGFFSVKSDVYSFGILLMEIISGKRNSSYYNPELSLNLIGYAWKAWNEDKVTELVDPGMKGSWSMREVSRCLNVGLLCVQDRANDRPTMASVMSMLEGENGVHPTPREPRFAADVSPCERGSSSFNQNIVSTNASITMLMGR
ncbi:G-type lectin S-receptor-like serine/threonine-protein kinase B120 [Apostasia shenzhenica]|uniref:Receptor-like serine/threonine-protein kinase n=1 Tax=Apostasia shenzhenica TaxID=1088818 RepID=A0A2I0B7A3_9ASPA|nr:G-type lectin S-receptor-like serine/threonine-protein kinase B120 [Apostasia shenzhenica]